jgi:hypothetical protein
MIVGFNKNCNNALVLTGLLTLILSGCGGGGPEDSPPTTNNSSVVTTSTATTASAVISSSAPATSNAASSVSSVKSSLAVASSEPAKPVNSSSSQSNYTRSSRASSQASSFDEFDSLPPEDEDIFDLPPTAPSALQVDRVSANEIGISWQASTDDTGLARYEIRRDSVIIGTASANQLYFEDVGLNANTYYTYTVQAIDLVGNRSNFSNLLVARTTIPIANSSASSNSSFSQSAASESSSSSRGVRVVWVTPSSREDGTYLELNEIGGYEIRYKPANSSVYLREIITDRHATTYERADLTRDAIFEIAAFDTNGRYSHFIQLMPH